MYEAFTKIYYFNSFLLIEYAMERNWVNVSGSVIIIMMVILTIQVKVQNI